MEALKIEVSIKDTEPFKATLEIFSEAMNDPRIPEEVRNYYVSRLVDAGVLSE